MSISAEELAVTKLQLEIDHLRKPVYTTPSFWISAVSVLVAVVGVMGQSYVSTVNRAQAEVSRDLAVLAKEQAQKKLDAIEVSRLKKQAELAELNSKIESLNIELDNRNQKLSALVAAVNSTNVSGSGAVYEAANAASKSLYSIAIYTFGFDKSLLSSSVSELSASGYTILRSAQIDNRPSWLSSHSVVLFYDESSRGEAENVANLIHAKTSLSIAVEMGAGSGVDSGKEKTSLRIHLVK